MDSLLNFFMKVRRLSYIERCSNTPHIRPYNVSEHSYYIALFAMVFADIENHRAVKTYGEKIYDTSEVIKKALIHDLEESVTGDILYPLHHNNENFKIALDIVRREAINTHVFKGLPQEIQTYYIALWNSSKDYSKEGRLVACMDKFEILMFAVHEIEMGNRAFSGLYDNAIYIINRDFDIESVKEVIAEIKKIYS